MRLPMSIIRASYIKIKLKDKIRSLAALKVVNSKSNKFT